MEGWGQVLIRTEQGKSG